MPERQSAESRENLPAYEDRAWRGHGRVSGEQTMRVWAGVLAVVCVATGPAVQAQSYSAFGFKPPAALVVPAFSDEELSALLATLDALVAGATTQTPPSRQSADSPTPPGRQSADGPTPPGRQSADDP